MLNEIKNVAQKKDDPGYRKWFVSDNQELIVWYSENDLIMGFQLCYNKQTFEHAITWKFDTGFKHHKIDCGDGYGGGGPKSSPILVKAINPPSTELLTLFEKESAHLEYNLVQFILEKLKTYTT